MNRINIIVIAGPTASGKTALAVSVAKKFNGEVISADSMQIYTGLDIATAKPTEAEMQGVPHHLIGVIDNNTPFSVADYVKMAKECIAEVSSRGKIPIIAGGTGLYISSLLDNIQFDNIDNDLKIRNRLLKECEEIGKEAMFLRLNSIDSKSAQTIHPNNITRVIRALEIYEATGIKFSDYKDMNNKCFESPYNAAYLGLNYLNRALLYDRINQRVDIMIQNGLIEEALSVYTNKNLKTIRQAIGYKELIPYFENMSSLDECVCKIKLETRHYAKRQLTWFRRDERINWIYPDENVNFENIIDKCEKYIVNSFEI